MEWDGNDYSPELDDPIIYYTIGNIDPNHEVIKRALASAIQRDGIAVSLGEANKLIDSGHCVHGHGVHAGGAYEFSFYEDEYISYPGVETDSPADLTFVEISDAS